MRRVARTCWPFKGARFLHPRPLPHRRQLPPPPRRGSHLNFNSPRTAGRRGSAGGGHRFARVGCSTSGWARPVSPLHSRPLRIKSKRTPASQSLGQPPRFGSRPACPLHLRLRPQLAGLGCPWPRPPRPSAAETAIPRGPRMRGRAPRGSGRSRPNPQSP